VTHVLPMTAGQLGDPLALCVEMETDNRTLHAASVRAVARVTFPNAGASTRFYLGALSRLSAVHNHGVAHDERGCVRAEPDDGRGDLVGRPHPPDRLLSDHSSGGPRECRR
jgi:hypothetical protein